MPIFFVMENGLVAILLASVICQQYEEYFLHCRLREVRLIDVAYWRTAAAKGIYALDEKLKP